LQDGESEGQATGIVTSRTRWLAVAIGFFTGVAGSFGLGLGFASVPIFLIVGAIIQPRFPRTGRGLMCAGALWLTFWVFDVGVLMLIEKHPYDHLGMINLLTVVSVLLVTLCDLAIVIEEAKIRRATRGLTYTR
jgi:hypothetical protein